MGEGRVTSLSRFTGGTSGDLLAKEKERETYFRAFLTSYATFRLIFTCVRM